MKHFISLGRDIGLKHRNISLKIVKIAFSDRLKLSCAKDPYEQELRERGDNLLYTKPGSKLICLTRKKHTQTNRQPKLNSMA
jgi:hypothetical protein